MELKLDRTGDQLTVSLGDLTTTVAWSEVALTEQRIEQLLYETATFGQHLYQVAFSEAMREVWTTLNRNERVLVVASDPTVAELPWEYLHDGQGLLTNRFNWVRGLPLADRRNGALPQGEVKIVAIPVSPVDELRVLNTEQEYLNLVQAVRKPQQVVHLNRVRPPTLAQMERVLPSQGLGIIHFMGHSDNRTGQGVLAFEDARARKQVITAEKFAEALDDTIYCVILNSCLSAAISHKTEFGNIALGLVKQGIPYALGMQFTIPDAAALQLSEALFDFLLGGRSIEEAVRRTRRVLSESALPHSLFLAGIPVLYTNQREAAPPITLTAGTPIIHPDPETLKGTFNLSALTMPTHFVGRADEISEILDALLGTEKQNFVLLHGMGGTGKTALAQMVAQRVGYHYQDRVLAVSFENLATFDEQDGLLTFNTQFADGFYNTLARYYGLDTSEPRFQERDNGQPIALQQAILQERTLHRSCLLLDNVETLLMALEQQHPAALRLGAFVKRLGEGQGAVLLTSRALPPTDWGKTKVIAVGGAW